MGLRFVVSERYRERVQQPRLNLRHHTQSWRIAKGVSPEHSRTMIADQSHTQLGYFEEDVGTPKGAQGPHPRLCARDLVSYTQGTMDRVRNRTMVGCMQDKYLKPVTTWLLKLNYYQSDWGGKKSTLWTAFQKVTYVQLWNALCPTDCMAIIPGKQWQASIQKLQLKLLCWYN